MGQGVWDNQTSWVMGHRKDGGQSKRRVAIPAADSTWPNSKIKAKKHQTHAVRTARKEHEVKRSGKKRKPSSFRMQMMQMASFTSPDAVCMLSMSCLNRLPTAICPVSPTSLPHNTFSLSR